MCIKPTSLSINYSVGSPWPRKVVDHLAFLLPLEVARKIKDSNEEIPCNTLEYLGNKGMSWIPSVPTGLFFIDKHSGNPKIWLVAFATFTILSIQFMFYPINSLKTLKELHDFVLPKIPGSYIVNFWTYTFATHVTFCLTLRAAGRLYNETLLENFYKNKLV